LAYIESEDAGMASLLRGYIAGDEDIRDALRQINAGSGTAQVGDAGWGQVLNCEFLACSQALMILLTEE
jgi:hypothetical protein